LNRTLTGFADHESLGMLMFFVTLLCYSLLLNYFDKKPKEEKGLLKSILFGLLIGFFSAVTLASWGGISNFIFMIIPLSFGLFWLLKVKEEIDEKALFNYIMFYLVWFVTCLLFSLGFGFDFNFVIMKMVLSLVALINGIVLLFIIIDFLLIKYAKNFLETKDKIKKYRVLLSIGIAFIIGLILLSFNGGNIISFIPNLIQQFLQPFGASRTGLTVSENLQPYLIDWISQITLLLFWTFYLGMLFIGYEMAKGVSNLSNKIYFSVFWIILISCVLLSRIGPTSLLNGENFISSFFYFGSLIAFGLFSAWFYFNDEVKISNRLLIISSWLLFMLIGGRGAIRLLFVVAPFICFMCGYTVVKLFTYFKKSKDIYRLILIILIIVIVIGLFFSSISFVKSISLQSKGAGPSANLQWQNSMKWVRDNTSEGSLFLHWWDYGYWVQYLGERPSLTDGGHGNSFWDHLIGRYVLTTPYPETALSFMKSHEIDYLLIDFTDLGKYGAYSKIGSKIGDLDRFSNIPIMQAISHKIIETAEGVTIPYEGGSYLDEDIIYDLEGKLILLPANRAAVIGIIIGTIGFDEGSQFKQPIGVFTYRDEQINLPIRYIYIENKIIDFGSGIDSIIFIIPKVSQTSQGLRLDEQGTIIYLSSKTSKSLFAQLYLLDDVFGNYDSLELVNSELDLIVNDLNKQGASLENIIYFNGIRGPIKIWKVNHQENILIKEEFLQTSGEYASFDDLVFTK